MSNTFEKVQKDPQAVLSYGFDWANMGDNDGTASDYGWLQGDTIATSTWAISGDDALLINDSDNSSNTETSIILSAGTVNENYLVTNHIVTAGGFEDERSIYVQVVDR